MADMFGANLEKVFESINSTIRLAAEFGAPEQQEIAIYSKLAEKLVAIEVKYNTHKKALQESTNEVTLEEFDRRYQSNTTTGKTNVKQLKRYKDFIGQAKMFLKADQEGGPSGDDDLQVEDTICDIDPITKRPLEIPVRNKKCNHVYEKRSIEELIRNNPRTRCPVMGCAANEYVSLGDLQEDKMLQHKLRLQRQNEQEM
ncbi:quijote [Culex quinquefasciatus]|uniref:E3 SUMO-protein ligase NSE2 n=1 Tax=Culex quinquefasciatus TaxID=7176 RepID=B0WQ62_CULQU|nr:E3 SUMO-protein ligase NSE2 [Culex quinquefasciatus]XP_039448374.1 E3 SUMO-protein ligase NSE2-like [Culex pipiens pallens]EDS32716.1 quijote [Culex quinquefasciatus]|eukprot:XP_001850846.1 quijote [Culex quinquefasciatus]